MAEENTNSMFDKMEIKDKKVQGPESTRIYVYCPYYTDHIMKNISYVISSDRIAHMIRAISYDAFELD